MDSTATFGPGWACEQARDWSDPRENAAGLPPYTKDDTVGPSTYDGPVGIHAMPIEWRMKDDDGHVYAKGIANDGAVNDDEGSDPLTCWGFSMGCTLLEIRENGGEWKAHIG